MRSNMIQENDYILMNLMTAAFSLFKMNIPLEKLPQYSSSILWRKRVHITSDVPLFNFFDSVNNLKTGDTEKSSCIHPTHDHYVCSEHILELERTVSGHFFQNESIPGQIPELSGRF